LDIDKGGKYRRRKLIGNNMQKNNALEDELKIDVDLNQILKKLLDCFRLKSGFLIISSSVEKKHTHN
jgi:hypothetical protein